MPVPYRFVAPARARSGPAGPAHRLPRGVLPKPPREQPRAWACGPPFTPSARGLCIGTYHSGVDREPLQIAIGRDGLEYPIKDTGLDPSIVTPLGRLIGTKPVCREVAPAGPRARQPQHRIQKTTTITAGTALPLATARHEPLQSRPLIVSQHFAFHASLQKPALNQNCLPKGILKLSPQPSANFLAISQALARQSRDRAPYLAAKAWMTPTLMTA